MTLILLRESIQNYVEQFWQSDCKDDIVKVLKSNIQIDIPSSEDLKRFQYAKFSIQCLFPILESQAHRQLIFDKPENEQSLVEIITDKWLFNVHQHCGRDPNMEWFKEMVEWSLHVFNTLITKRNYTYQIPSVNQEDEDSQI